MNEGKRDFCSDRTHVLHETKSEERKNLPSFLIEEYPEKKLAVSTLLTSSGNASWENSLDTFFFQSFKLVMWHLFKSKGHFILPDIPSKNKSLNFMQAIK